MLRIDRNNSYLELRKFLEDVYIYLNNQITEQNDESTSATEHKPTDLITRCKDILNIYEIEHEPQLEQAYLEMNGNNKFDQPCEYVDVTSPVTDAVDVSTNESMEIVYDEQTNLEPKVNYVTDVAHVVCPFSGLPAAHLVIKKSPKIGSLQRIKDNYIFNQSRMKYYSGLLDGWLLMYSNSCDLKPTICLNLQNYDLCNRVEYRKREQFELISNEWKTDKPKKYLLQAASASDYEEWLQAITTASKSSQIRRRLNSISRKLPSPPPCFESESIPRLSGRSEGIYEEPSEMFSTQSYPSFQFDNWTQLPLAPALPVKSGGSKCKIESNVESVAYDTPKSPPKPTAPDLDHQNKIRQVKSHLTMQMLAPKQIAKSSSAEKSSNADEEKLKEKSKKKSKVEARDELPKFSKRNWFLNRLSGRSVTTSSKLKMEMMENVADDVHVSYDPVESRLDGKRGGKVNMIINQLEANGHFPLRKERFKERRLSKYGISNVDDEESHNYELVTVAGRNTK